MNLLKRLKGKGFSARSQKSYRAEFGLRKQLWTLREKIRHCQSLIDNAQAEIERLSNTTVAGEGWATELIPKSASKVRDEKDKLSALEPARERIQAQIDALTNPRPTEMKARVEHQKALAELALERLEVDRELARTARTLLGMLEKRSDMTGRMGGLAAKLDFTFASDGLDSSRFAALRAPLQEDIEGASEEWVDAFLGDNRTGRITMEPYRVQDDVLFIEETLANAGAFRRGDQVNLTAKQLSEIRSKEERRLAHSTETMPGGAIRSGETIEVRVSRVEKIGDSVRSVYQRG